jgi:hypothetical protein
MGDAERFPRLKEDEQEVLLCANEREDLFHVVWGLRRGDATDEELRPRADAIIRKLIGLGWVRLARAWQDKLPPGEHQMAMIVGRAWEIDNVYREEAIAPEEFDALLRDPRSWDLEDMRVVLVPTDEGDEAIANGVLDEAYAKFGLKRNDDDDPSA